MIKPCLGICGALSSRKSFGLITYHVSFDRHINRLLKLVLMIKDSFLLYLGGCPQYAKKAFKAAVILAK